MDCICGNRRLGKLHGRNCWFFGVTAMIRAFAFVAAFLSFATSVHAESIPATTGTLGYVESSHPAAGPFSTKQAACDYLASTMTLYGRTVTVSPDGNYCNVNYSSGAVQSQVQISTVTGKTCPANQNWTLSGGFCTRPDCVAPQIRQSDGTCTTTCVAGQTKEVSYFSGKWAVCDKQSAGCLTGTLSVPSTYCDGKCVYSLADSINSAPAVAGATVDKPSPVYVYKNGTNTGQTCTVADNTSAPAPPTIPQKAPPCAPGEGVLTSSSGTVKCVPSATPGNTPTVSTKTKVDTFSDGSKKTTTTTTTTDPVSGSTNTSDSVNTTGAGGGSTPGQAGTPGSSSSNSDASNTKGTANEPGQKDQKGDCQIEPDAPHCREFKSPGTDGLYQKKEKTMDSVFSTFSSTVKGSSLGSAASGFFNVSSPSGSCPNWSLTVPFLNVQLDGASFFCSGSILAAMDGAGAVLLALATYIAFTWAFL